MRERHQPFEENFKKRPDSTIEQTAEAERLNRLRQEVEELLKNKDKDANHAAVLLHIGENIGKIDQINANFQMSIIDSNARSLLNLTLSEPESKNYQEALMDELQRWAKSKGYELIIPKTSKRGNVISPEELSDYSVLELNSKEELKEKENRPDDFEAILVGINTLGAKKTVAPEGQEIDHHPMISIEWREKPEKKLLQRLSEMSEDIKKKGSPMSTVRIKEFRPNIDAVLKNVNKSVQGIVDINIKEALARETIDTRVQKLLKEFSNIINTEGVITHITDGYNSEIGEIKDMIKKYCQTRGCEIIDTIKDLEGEKPIAIGTKLSLSEIDWSIYQIDFADENIRKMVVDEKNTAVLELVIERVNQIGYNQPGGYLTETKKRLPEIKAVWRWKK